MKNFLGDRIKENYENRSRYYLTRRTPVIVRVDGKAFHTLTAKYDKPFDACFIQNMLDAAILTACEVQGFKLAYVQSDEISFLITDYDRIETDAYFDYNKSKLESVISSYATAYFNMNVNSSRKTNSSIAVFDGRAFNIPKEEIANYFLWRAKDWERNSIHMYLRCFYSDKEIRNKNREEQHEMLYAKGKNWATDLAPSRKNGHFIYKEDGLIRFSDTTLPNYEDINKVVNLAISETK